MTHTITTATAATTGQTPKSRSHARLSKKALALIAQQQAEEMEAQQFRNRLADRLSQRYGHWNMNQQAALTRFIQSYGLEAATYAAAFAEEISSYWRKVAGATDKDELTRQIAAQNEQLDECFSRIAQLEGLLLNQTALYEAEREGLVAQLDQCQCQVVKGEIQVMSLTEELRCQQCQTHHIWLEDEQHRITKHDGSAWWASSYLCMVCFHVGVFLKPRTTHSGNDTRGEEESESGSQPGQPQPAEQLNLF